MIKLSAEASNIKSTNHAKKKKLLVLHNLVTLMTVQWYRDPGSQGRGLKSLLGTPDGTLPGRANDIAVHSKTINGTP